MGTYNWANAYVSGFALTGLAPKWWTPSDPVQAISCESPNGPGDVLVRTELSANQGLLNYITGGFANPADWYLLTTVMLGEVYSVGSGGFPDPRAGGVNSGVITAVLGNSVQPIGTATAETDGLTMQTPGLITSKGRRGPDKYGGGHPELRVGLWTSNCGTWSDTVGGATSAWTYWLRTLWYTP